MGNELKGIDGITRQIEALNRAADEIRTCRDIPGVKRLADHAQLIKLAARRVGASIEVQNEATAVAIRARHWQGCLIRDMGKHRGGRPRSNGKTPDMVSGVSAQPTLKELGISEKESSRAQAIAAVPEEEVERTIALAIRDGRELTTREVYLDGLRRQRRRRRRARLDDAAAEDATAPAGRRWEVHEGDCLEVFRSFRDSVRLIFADPPYNQGVDYGDHCDDRRDPAEYLEWSRRWIEAAGRALTPDGSLWILISYRWAARIQVAAEDAGLHLRQWLTWYESFGQNMGPDSRKFNLCSRPLLWLVKDPRRFVFNDAPEIRRPSDRQAKYDDKRAEPDGKFWDDVWGINPQIPRLHGTAAERLDDFPTQLPLRLLRPIVACASEPGDMVVDPFSGSGTTGCACIELGRHFMGVERSAEFARLSRERLAAHEGEGPSRRTAGPAPWTESELARKATVEAGGSVIAHIRVDARLIEWAKVQGLYVRIDRETEWGNPYVVDEDGTREEVIGSFAVHLANKPSLRQRCGELRGKVLGCWCYPHACHGEALIRQAYDEADASPGTLGPAPRVPRRSGRRTGRPAAATASRGE